MQQVATSYLPVLFLGSFWVILEVVLGAPGGREKEPKLEPKQNKIEDEQKRCNKKLFKIVLGRSWSRLGAILGPSWPHLRPSWADFERSGGGRMVVFS